jgi:hypothetical protein
LINLYWPGGKELAAYRPDALKLTRRVWREVIIPLVLLYLEHNNNWTASGKNYFPRCSPVIVG